MNLLFLLILCAGVYAQRLRHSWPFPLLSIGNNMQTYQDYGTGAYWHDGLDIRGNENEKVYAAAGGKVVNIQNYNTGPLYWEIAILDDEGNTWKYHHIDSDSIDVKLGAHVDQGTYLGDLVYWPQVTFGERYHHLHLLVVGPDKKYINPLLLLEPLRDLAGPQIARVGLAQNHKPIGKNKVQGPHSLFVESSDLILHQLFAIPPHKISYVLDGAKEVVVWEFINLPSQTNDEDYIDDFYLKGTCGNYQCRRFLFNLNFSPESPRGQLTLAKGKHEILVNVEDLSGNKSAQKFEYEVY